jgi:predicted YcjX-like family ATPase
MVLGRDARTWWRQARRLVPDRLPDWDRVEGQLKVFGETLLDRRLKIAVTGLSRAGKTVFITSLAHHLERGVGLPFLNAVADRRYLGAVPARHVPAGITPFPYHAHHAALAGETPYWPAPSTDLSLLRLELRFKPRGRMARQFGEQRTLTLDIVDYPGEWLIDLPLLEESYAGWAGVTLGRLAAEPYRTPMAAFFDALRAGDADTVVRAYVEGLDACRRQRLSLLQPGRALTPTAVEGAPEAALFAPVPADHPLAGRFRARFETYVERWVRPFKTHVVDAVDRQIVLVDVLESLNRGPAHFDDTRAAIALVLEGFNHGRSGYWQRLLAPKVEKLVFCATKADHVANTQHANLKLLLQDMVDDAARRVQLEGIPTDALAVAALRSTDTVRTHYDGQLLSCVRGVPVASGKEKIVFPGEVPPTMPRGADWNEQHFDFRRFAPRRLDGRQRNGHGHIRLDQVLEAVIGDRLL